jgi:hypothetical protein
VIRPDSSASSRKSWIPGLGLVIALLVCIGLMAHAASIDSDTTTAVASAVAVSADPETVVLSDSPPGEAQMSASADWIGLCVLLGVMCALTLLILRNFAALPRRNEQYAPRQLTDIRGMFVALCGGPAASPALMVPLRV